MNTIEIGSLWWRRLGDQIQLLAKCDGDWLLVSEQHYDANFSEMVSPNAIACSRRDPVTSPPTEKGGSQ